MTATHDHDIDLLMTLAAEGADPSSKDVADRLDHCTRCLEDLRMQLVAIEAVRLAAVPALSDLERRRLRRSVDEGLGIERRPASSAAPSPRAARMWQVLAGTAAVVLAVAVAVPMLGSGGGDDSTDEVAASFAEGDADGADMAVEERADLFTTADDSESWDDSTTTVMATDGDDPAAAGYASPAAVTELASLLSVVEAEDDPDVARAKAAAVNENLAPSITEDHAVEENACAVEGSLMIGGPSESFTLGTFELDPGSEPVVVTVHREPSGLTTLIAHDAETCGVLEAVS